MAITSATLDDIPILVTGDVGWRLTSGVEPYQRTFNFHRSYLTQFIKNRGKPVRLNIQSDTDDPIVVDNLWILREVPTEHPDLACLLVSDVRWKWRYEWIIRRYNIKRRTGNRTLVNSDSVLKQIQFATDDLAYAPFSLMPPEYHKRWHARDVVRDVFSAVTNGNFEDAESIYALAVEIEGLTLDDSGENAVRRVMAMVPGVNCFIQPNGIAKLYNMNDGSEFDLQLGDPFVGSSLVEKISMAQERPSKIHVHFTCEDEIRFDFVEGTSTRDADGRWLKNVMPLPFTMGVTAATANDENATLAAGTWVEINDDLLAAMSTKFPPITPSGKTLPTLTLSILRQIWINGGYNRYHDCYDPGGGDPAWSVFMAAIKNHYRQTFQVNRRWADRIIDYLPRRVSLIDPVNNVWAQPGIYTNYALIPSYRRAGKTDADPTQLAYNREAFSTPSSAPNVNLFDIKDKQARAELKIIDRQLGIFHVGFLGDPSGDTTGIIPSSIVGFDPSSVNSEFEIPSANVDGPLKVLSHSKMKNEHATSIVLTVMTGAPNNLNQTWDQEVTFEEAKSVLPLSVAKLLPDAIGPEMHVHVGPGVETARFAWSDTLHEQIEAAILQAEPPIVQAPKPGEVPGAPPVAPDGEPQAPRLGRVARKDYAQLMVNDIIVTDIARGIAANIYSGLVDHLEGAPTVRRLPTVYPTGRVGAVEHGLTTEGVAYTKLTMLPPSKGIDFWSLLPEFARRILRGILPGN